MALVRWFCLGAERLAAPPRRCDLKPENIFLSEDPEAPGGERVKILDFGIAKFVNGDQGKQTSTGMVLGTPKYISPEQCDGREHLSGKADVYSLGGRVPREISRGGKMRDIGGDAGRTRRAAQVVGGAVGRAVMPSAAEDRDLELSRRLWPWRGRAPGGRRSV